MLNIKAKAKKKEEERKKAESGATEQKEDGGSSTGGSGKGFSVFQFGAKKGAAASGSKKRMKPSEIRIQKGTYQAVEYCGDVGLVSIGPRFKRIR